MKEAREFLGKNVVAWLSEELTTSVSPSLKASSAVGSIPDFLDT